MVLFMPSRSVHSIGAHLRRAVGHAGKAVGDAAKTVAKGAVLGAGVVGGIGAVLKAKELYDSRPKWQR